MSLANTSYGMSFVLSSLSSSLPVRVPPSRLTHTRTQEGMVAWCCKMKGGTARVRGTWTKEKRRSLAPAHFIKGWRKMQLRESLYRGGSVNQRSLLDS